MNKKKHAFFVTYGGGHIKMTIPVVNELQNRGWKTTILGLTTAAVELKKQKIPYLGFKDFIQPSDHWAINKGKELATSMHNAATGVDLEESIAYLGLSYADLIAELGEEAAHAAFSKRQRHAFLPLNTLRKAIDQIQPDVVITTHSPRAEKAAIQVAQERHLPNVCMMDLFGIKEMYRVFADIVCVLSQITKDNLIADGVPAENIVVTGNPAFDILHHYQKATDYAWREQHLHIHHNERAVLWTDQACYWILSKQKLHFITPEERVAMLSLLHETCKKLSVKLLIRPHPNQHLGPFKEWCDQQPSTEVQLVHHLPLYPLLNAADTIVTRTSTVGLETVLMKKPLLIIEPEPGLSVLPLANYHMALSAVTSEEIQQQLCRLLTEPAVAEQIKQAANQLPIDGKSAIRVADQIERC